MHYNVKLPNIHSIPDTEAKINAVIDAVFSMDRALKVLFANIDADNMVWPISSVIRQFVDTAAGLNSYVGREEYQSAIQQTAAAIKLRVTKGDLISEINAAAGEILIKANKIDLKGYVSVNEYFRVDEEGKFYANKGKIGGFEIGDGAVYYGLNTAEDTPQIYFGPVNVMRPVSIAGSGARADWRFLVGLNAGFTSQGDLYCNDGFFGGTVDAKKIRYGAGNMIPSAAIDGGSTAEALTESELEAILV